MEKMIYWITSDNLKKIVRLIKSFKRSWISSSFLSIFMGLVFNDRIKESRKLRLRIILIVLVKSETEVKILCFIFRYYKYN